MQLGLPFTVDDAYATECVNLTDVTLDEGDIRLFAQSRKSLFSISKCAAV